MQPLSTVFSPDMLMLLFFVLLLIFTIQAIVFSYHWFTFGNSRSVSLTALALYLLGGAILLLTFSLALNTQPF